MRKAFGHFLYVRRIRFDTAAFGPLALHFSRHVAKYRHEAVFDLDVIRKIAFQLLHAYLGDIGPHAQHI